LVAAREDTDKLAWIGVECPHRHIQRRIVIHHARFGAHRRWLTLRRLALQEIRHRRRLLPDFLAETAVENNRAVGRHCDGFNRHRRSSFVRRRSCGRRSQRGCRHPAGQEQLHKHLHRRHPIPKGWGMPVLLSSCFWDVLLVAF
jgi:hypothetical protein